jgi:hypothetical protein
MSFMCDDIQATVRDLRAKGIEIRGDDGVAGRRRGDAL